MKIYVVGTGGVGGYFGGLLARAGQDVTFVARGEHLQAIRRKGLVVKSVAGDFTVAPAQAIGEVAQIVDPDLVLFTVKSYDTKEAARELAAMVHEGTTIISFQNGVDNDLQIREEVQRGDIFPGAAYVVSTKTHPGLIEQTGGPRKLIFGDRDNPGNPRLKEIEQLFQSAAIDATASDDITRDLWEKFIFINAFSGMTALCLSPIGEVLGDSRTRALFERCLREAISVARAMRVDIAESRFDAMMATALNFAPDSKSSLLVDVEAGRRNEIEALNGALARFGRQHGVDVPINELIYGAIKQR